MNNESLNILGQLKLMETRGYSAYEVAQLNGYTGTEAEWLASLVGPQATVYHGTSDNRPTQGLFNGLQYFDETLGKPIWYNNESWYDALGDEV